MFSQLTDVQVGTYCGWKQERGWNGMEILRGWMRMEVKK